MDKSCLSCRAPLVRPRKYSADQWERMQFCNRRGRSEYRRPRSVTITPKGYVKVRRPDLPIAHSDGRILEHRAVLYDAGIRVPPGWNVHHRNGNKRDNRLTNLAVLTPQAHNRLHRHSCAA